MKIHAVKSYAALLRQIEELRRKASRKKLVFRGQVKFYKGKVVPSIARPSSVDYLGTEHPSWYNLVVAILMKQLAEYMNWRNIRDEGRKQKKGKPKRARPSPETCSSISSVPKGTLGTHIQALLQHYGARSHYVDVTKSLSVALWFAHHQHASMHAPLLPGDVPDLTSPLDPFGPLPLYDVAWYERAWPKNKVGYVFAISPNVSDPSAPGKFSVFAQHGDLIDLTPNYIAKRIGRQRAGLLYADVKSSSGGDLGTFVKRVFKFALPLRGAPRFVTRAETLSLFPSPRQDFMYRQILSAIPFRTDLENPFDMPRMVRIPEYYRSFRKALGSNEWKNYRACDTYLRRGLLFPFLAESNHGSASHDAKNWSLRDSVPIICPDTINVIVMPQNPPKFDFDKTGPSLFFECAPFQAGLTLQELTEGREQGFWVIKTNNSFWCRVFSVSERGLPNLVATHGHSFVIDEGKGLILSPVHIKPESSELNEIVAETDALTIALGLLADVADGRRELRTGTFEPYLVVGEHHINLP